MSKVKFDRVVKALGGTSATARAIGRTPAQVCQWRQRRGKFPAQVYLALQAALDATGKPLDAREVCRFDSPIDPPPQAAG